MPMVGVEAVQVDIEHLLRKALLLVLHTRLLLALVVMVALVVVVTGVLLALILSFLL